MNIVSVLQGSCEKRQDIHNRSKSENPDPDCLRVVVKKPLLALNRFRLNDSRTSEAFTESIITEVYSFLIHALGHSIHSFFQACFLCPAARPHAVATRLFRLMQLSDVGFL